MREYCFGVLFGNTVINKRFCNIMDVFAIWGAIFIFVGLVSLSPKIACFGVGLAFPFLLVRTLLFLYVAVFLVLYGFVLLVRRTEYAITGKNRIFK